ncbi:YadA C-terminal domain-containing protein [Comamonadaceae bacterium M7527]|nr:YadA C-terminal domain-containing protein [Comamonadaceae bacterium M7527]
MASTLAPTHTPQEPRTPPSAITAKPQEAGQAPSAPTAKPSQSASAQRHWSWTSGSGQHESAKSAAISAAATDATTKAEAAKTAAINTAAATAQEKVNTAKSDAINTAATDATTKVNALANGQVATNKQDVEAVTRKATRTRRMVKQVNEHLGLGGKRGNNVRNSDTVVLSASRAITGANAEETTADDGIEGQLDSVDQSLSKGIADNTKRIDGNTQGIANVTAMASMPALPAGADSGFTAGVGAYSGKNALAIGFQHRLSANTTFKVAAATGSNGKATVGAGFSYSWGGSNRSIPDQGQQVVVLQDQLRVQAAAFDELKRQQAAEKAAQAAENAELKQRMAALMAQVEKLASK